MAKMTINQGVFELLHTVGGHGTFTDIIATQNTFVDKNIAIKITVPEVGTGTLAITDQPDTNINIGEVSNGYYPLTTPLSGTISYNTAGWMGTGNISVLDSSVTVGRIAQSTLSEGSSATNGYVSTITVTPSPTSNKYVNITPGYNSGRYVTIAPMSSGTTATATVSLTYTPAIPQVTDINAAVSGKTRVALSTIGTASSVVGTDYTYYASVQAKTPSASIANGNSGFSKKVTRAGYLGPASDSVNTTQITTTATLNEKTQTYYIPLTSGEITITATGTATQPSMAVSNTDGSNAGINIGATSGMLGTPTDTEPNTEGGYYVAFTATAPPTSITSSISTTIDTAGWIGNANQVNASGSISGSNKTWYSTIRKATLTNVSSLATATPSGLSLGAESNSVPTQGKYIKVEGQGTVKVNQTGFAYSTLQQSSTKKTVYYPVATAQFTTSEGATTATTAGWVDLNTVVANISDGSLANTPTANHTYTTLNSPAIDTNDGYLYINAGYFSDSKISLGTLIPDSATTDVVSNALLPNYEAYDTEGHHIIGGMTIYDGDYTASSGWAV